MQEYVCFVLFCLINHILAWFCKLPTLVHLEVLFDLHWDMHLYGLTTCLCLLFLLSALLTRVVCACVHYMCPHQCPLQGVCMCICVCTHMHMYVRA